MVFQFVNDQIFFVVTKKKMVFDNRKISLFLYVLKKMKMIFLRREFHS